MPDWLEKAVFYEIYPQTFFDSNGDGIGDLPGILQKLEYLQYLGVNAVWLNPCFASPFQDAGYDVSDFYQVAPRYGTNADLRALFAEARRLGIRILLDLIPGHTSTENAWFKESCKPERNQYSDWYIWTNSIWTWNAPGVQTVIGYSERDGNYITNFFHFQPALNYGFANPDPKHPWQQPVDAPGPQAVRRELKNIMKFWLDLGASGFRVDMAGSLVKNDPGSQATARLWHEIRLWLDSEYPEAALVSEWSRPTVAIPAGFHMDFLLPFAGSAFQSLFRIPNPPGSPGETSGFFDPNRPGDIQAFLDEYLPLYRATRGQGFIVIPSGNHDTTPRLGNGRTPRDLELVFLFLLTIPGVPFIYYGDEIGMRSPQAIKSKEGGYNRTGARTPMHWDTTSNAGFSSAPMERLYLPVEAAPDRPNVAVQRANDDSLLNHVRRLIALRQAHPALCASGSFEPVAAEPGKLPFVYLRQAGNEKLLVALNPANQPCEMTFDRSMLTQAPEALYGTPDCFTPAGAQWRLRLPGVAGGVYRLQG
ncbi:MAG: alpha-amylase family glycosyl hydrolase [Anaerolineales bacterium]